MASSVVVTGKSVISFHIILSLLVGVSFSIAWIIESSKDGYFFCLIPTGGSILLQHEELRKWLGTIV